MTPHRNDKDFENRLDQLREQARLEGNVAGSGVRALGGPLPLPQRDGTISSYYGLPILKAPVWEWMVAVYFFIGGLGGMAALLAAVAWLEHDLNLTRAALWCAGVAAILSPILLTWDLGRPIRFLYMLRVFKYQSPMSVGSWIVSAFGLFALPALALSEWGVHLSHIGQHSPVVQLVAGLFTLGAAFFGIFLATYTGALIAVTAVPAWNLHRAILPFHFGMAGLGSASATLVLLGFKGVALLAVFACAAAAELLVLVWMELRTHGKVDAALHHGKSGRTLRIGEFLAGPCALALVLARQTVPASICMLLGALLTRFGWLSAGRASACDPQSVIESQTGSSPTAGSRRPYLLAPVTASEGSTRKGR